MKTILIQLDTDLAPSVFDRVVAVDAGVDELFSYSGIDVDNVTSCVHGAIFTRKPTDLKSTALFIGGSDTAAGEAVLAKVQQTFFGPMRVSVMLDSNGSNTTAAAAVLAARKHLNLGDIQATVLGGTGPVGCRAAQLLAGAGAKVRVGSRQLAKATEVCARLKPGQEHGELTPVQAGTVEDVLHACEGSQLLIAAGAAGAQFLAAEQWQGITGLKVAIDVNAVPPVGLQGIGAADRAKDIAGVLCYGAIGIGGTKMKIHKAALKQLFTTNDQVLDTTAIYHVGEHLI